MGCSFSGLTALYATLNPAGDIWIHTNRFRILRQLGVISSAQVFLVKQLLSDDNSAGLAQKLKDPSLISDDGVYVMAKLLIHSDEELEVVREEIRVAGLFSHRNLLPVLDHSVIAVKETHPQTWKYESYTLFPSDYTPLVDHAKSMKAKKQVFSTPDILHIFRQLCEGLKQMHSFDPPYAHNRVEPGKVLVKERKGQPPLAVLMDFKCTRPARHEIRSRADALRLQEWASDHCSASYRAPELWDCPSHADIDERTDIWSLGCTLYAIMYGVSPFEYEVGESGGSLQLAILNAEVKWPAGGPGYPEALHQFVTWMVQPQPKIRPYIDDVIIHVDKLIAKC